MNITIWGNELISWVAATAFAKAGNKVYFCPELAAASVEADYSIPESVNSEPGLNNAFQQQLNAGQVCLSNLEQAISKAQTHCFGFLTDQHHDAESLTAKLASAHPKDLLIINFSNFGIGKTALLQQHLDPSSRQLVAYIPDQLPAGAALDYFTRPSLMVVGSESDWAKDAIQTLFAPFQGGNDWQYMNTIEAEYTKFAINGMLALRLAYINDLANLADQFDIDIETVRNAMGMDERIGQHYLAPGCGFGGQQFPQYIEGLADTLSEIRQSSLLNTVLLQNEKQKELPFRKLWRHYDCDLSDKTISIWGLAFKPGTASIANAPSLKVISALLAQGCKVQAHDPLAGNNIETYFEHHPQHQQLTICSDQDQALRNSDGLLLLTQWKQYGASDLTQIRDNMKTALIVDGRNLFNKGQALQLGFSYYGIGR